MYSLKEDSRVPIICQTIVNNIPVKSVFICGSRATGQGVTDSSDYDIGMVMSASLIPFYWRKIKRLEGRLSQELNSNLVINPLPTFRLHRPRGNLFLFKLKREGTTLYGQDYLRILEPGNIEDININWYFSYLFSTMKGLIVKFDPALLTLEIDKETGRILTIRAAKAIIQCAEIQLFIDNHYETDPVAIISELRQSSHLVTDKIQFLKDLELAFNIKRGELDVVKNPRDFWLSAREHLLSTFRVLVLNHQDSDTENIKELAVNYSKMRNKTRLKNFQYFIQALMSKKEFFWNSLISGYSVEQRVWLAVILLLLSLDKSGHIDKECLIRSYNALKAYTVTEYSEDEHVLWKCLNKSVTEYYPLACSVMGA